MEYFYRYIDEMRCGCAITEWGGEDYYTTGPYLRLIRYPVIKRTPCGAWICMGVFLGGEPFDCSHKRFVNLKATKRFACETEEEALYSFMARKTRQISILTRQLRQAQEAFSLANQLMQPNA